MRTKWFRLPMMNIDNQQYIADDYFIEEVVKKDSIVRAIMSLNKSDREIIILYYYQELSVKEYRQREQIKNGCENGLVQDGFQISLFLKYMVIKRKSRMKVKKL